MKKNKIPKFSLITRVRCLFKGHDYNGFLAIDEFKFSELMHFLCMNQIDLLNATMSGIHLLNPEIVICEHCGKIKLRGYND